ncbi:MAG: type I-C CRISPR-associated protein Cas5c [Xanthobacter sp.]
MSFGVRLRVNGPFACFSRPEMKVERVSYDVMTPSAARGILEAIHWKPAIRWVVDEIHVLRPIQFQSLRRNEVGAKASSRMAASAMKSGDISNLMLVVDENRQQRAATVLSKVDYIICAHFEMTDRAGDGDNPGKHMDTFTRRVRRGQCFHQPCLGMREFVADFSLLEPDEPMPQADEEHRTPTLGFGHPRDLGIMLHDIDHAGDKNSMFFRARLQDGVMQVPAPGSAEIYR